MLLTLGGCGKPQLHVSTVSGAPGVLEDPDTGPEEFADLSEQSGLKNSDLTESGLGPDEESAEVSSGQEPDISTSSPVKPEPSPTPTFSFDVQMKPAGSKVTFLNAPLSYSSGMALQPGEYEIEVAKEGYETARWRVMIQKDDVVIDVELTPLPDTTRPTITIISHDINQEVKVASNEYHTHIRGVAQDAGGIVKVTVNAKSVGIDAAGQFAEDLVLKVGDNPIHITAMDTSGNKTETDFIIQRLAAVFPPVGQTYPSNKFGDYHALVIGINKYKKPLPPLETAVNDAKAVAALLRKEYQFSVETLYDEQANESQILEALDRLRLNLEKSDNLLIYYAGHGELIEKEEQGYWLPVDAHPYKKAQWISNTTITDYLRSMDVKHILVVADSCYSGTLVDLRTIDSSTMELREGGHWEKYYQKLIDSKIRIALTSGSEQPVKDREHKDDQHSYFAKNFLAILTANKGVLESGELYRNIRRPLLLNTDAEPRHDPIYNTGHDSGEFLFYRPPIQN